MRYHQAAVWGRFQRISIMQVNANILFALSVAAEVAEHTKKKTQKKNEKKTTTRRAGKNQTTHSQSQKAWVRVK